MPAGCSFCGCPPTSYSHKRMMLHQVRTAPSACASDKCDADAAAAAAAKASWPPEKSCIVAVQEHSATLGPRAWACMAMPRRMTAMCPTDRANVREGEHRPLGGHGEHLQPGCASPVGGQAQAGLGVRVVQHLMWRPAHLCTDQGLRQPHLQRSPGRGFKAPQQVSLAGREQGHDRTPAREGCRQSRLAAAGRHPGSPDL